MGYSNITIERLLDQVNNDELILPAIQRSYVWDENRICSLFDSLMKNYPIGAFLFWDVSKEELQEFVFNKFVRDMDKIAGTIRGAEIEEESGKFTGVLDGQQRITSMLIGLAGAYKSRVPKERKIDGGNPWRYLALNLLSQIDDPSEDNYEFEFLSEQELATTTPGKHWFRVSEILNMSEKETYGYALAKLDPEYTQEQKLIAHENISRLHSVIRKDEVLSYYSATDRRLSDVVEIFERINNNGQALSGTDLMLSMASVYAKADMQKVVAEAITEIGAYTNSETGFKPDREFILTAALMATGAESISTKKKDNYRPKRVKKIYDNWDQITDAICQASRYIDKLGFNGSRIRKTYMHPIVYYFYKLAERGENTHNRYDSSKPEAAHDRKAITQWLLRAIIKKLFVEGSGKTLIDIRQSIDEALEAQKTPTFPLQQLRDDAKESRSLEISMDDAYDILSLQFGNMEVLPLLTALFDMPAQNAYQVDHLWPQAKMSTERRIIKTDGSLSQDAVKFFRSNYNSLPNLQLLKSTPNIEKDDTEFDQWLIATYPEEKARADYIKQVLIPDPQKVSFEYSNFEQFFKERRKLLLKKIKEYFDIQGKDDDE